MRRGVILLAAATASVVAIVVAITLVSSNDETSRGTASASGLSSRSVTAGAVDVFNHHDHRAFQVAAHRRLVTGVGKQQAHVDGLLRTARAATHHQHQSHQQPGAWQVVGDGCG